MTTRPTTPRRTAGTASSRKPNLRVERALQRDGYPLLAGMDEVGRGALAGPVTVGVVLIDESCRSAPVGVRDSKLLTPQARAAMVPRIQRWCRAHAVGHASPAEIDDIGIIAALRLAGRRALATLPEAPDLVILDGNHDWLTAPDEVGLLALTGDGAAPPPVTTMIKADLKCSSVAAASVLAKVTRDRLMVELAGEQPAYAWQENKGYAAPEHLAALAAHGPCDHHRRSWRLPGTLDDLGFEELGPRATEGVGLEELAARVGATDTGADGRLTGASGAPDAIPGMVPAAALNPTTAPNLTTDDVGMTAG